MALLFQGPVALSEFRRERLLGRCRRLVPSLADLWADHLYAVQTSRPLAGGEHQRLEGVLGTGGPADPGSDLAVVVAPRPGTISPWSSKATDILHNCGLDAVERVERVTAYSFAGTGLGRADLWPALPLLHDRMTEAVVEDVEVLFRTVEPRPLLYLPVLAQGRPALERANLEMGLALSALEIDYFLRVFVELERDPTDVELMTFSVVNSEHCRHKIFNAEWTIDGERQERSLFEMIRHTHAAHPEWTVKAYADNAGVVQGFVTSVFRPDPASPFTYRYRTGRQHVLIKVETHNHPTAISPYPGASTGVGGEIRDEGAAGTGGISQAGLCAFYTSHLRIPGYAQPWEGDWAEFPARLATPLQIMTEGPLGGAGFGNEFGRPGILGLFRTYEERVAGRLRGYHKPIMVAGGVGLIDAEHVDKRVPERGDYVVQIGGPAMLIGLGGGTASSMEAGRSEEDLDFASVQRDNPEMQRRCQELVNRCTALGADNPILSIHDLGAGGLSNGCPELVEKVGAHFDLRAVHSADPGMSPMQIWCNEAQERYVLVIRRSDLERFAEMARRERCLYAAIGEVTGDGRLTLHDPLSATCPIDLDLAVLLGKPPRLQRRAARRRPELAPLDLTAVRLAEAVERVLRFPAVASKTFLVTIADRTVTGLVARDQMVGPHQVPISDVALTAHSYDGYTGSAMAMGERAPLALIDAPASGRMAVAEAITNIAAAGIGPIGRVKLSGNWMCACGEEGEDADLYDTVHSVALDFCPPLGVSIPVGKDSLSMRAVWRDSRGQNQRIVAPLSLVISAFAPVDDVRRTVTPDLKADPDSRLLLVDLGHRRNRLGASCLAQVYNKLGNEGPDVDPAELGQLFGAIQNLVHAGLLVAYHDRSDGGLFVTVAEMAFGGQRGVDLEIGALGEGLPALFAEEIGVVLQVRAADEAAVRQVLAGHGLAALTHAIGTPGASAADGGCLRIQRAGHLLFEADVALLHAVWSELTGRLQAHRDNPACAQEEQQLIRDASDPGMRLQLTYEPSAPHLVKGHPRVAILREQGVNGQVEMAAAFDRAGCEAVDVTMTDLIAGRAELPAFQGLAACGGFSYGDVLGAGAGWARTILFHAGLREQFAAFFARPETFTLGVCNGCQMLSHLKELIPGAQDWPRFLRNRSEQFEARYVTVEVLDSPSVLLEGMAGSRLGIPCAHGEGRAAFVREEDLQQVARTGQVCLRYVDHRGLPTQRYPLNPNGSPGGITGLTSQDGRATILMPHPERAFRNVQLSWRPAEWQGEEGPWLRLFQNAYRFARGR
ncbi:MAG: phosphoribosylformylglycinamidine synthase [Candidatus Latescibacterota bacterium]